DSRLTIENLKTSLQFGAQALNYAKVTDFLYKDDQVSGVEVSDEVTGKTFSISAKQVVSAAGPWVDELRSVNNSKKGKRLHLTKGVHLVFPKKKLPVKQSVYFDIPDGRMMFAIPRGKVTYVGTTDTNFNLDKDDIKIDVADAIYLISAVNNMFPDINLELEDVISSWAGLRPLIHEEGKSASELSRKDEIFTSNSGLISIAGGKLTGYRKMAERIVNRVTKKMEEEQQLVFEPCTTDKIPLCGNEFKKFKHVKKYIADVYSRLKEEDFSEYDAWYLVTTYGKQTESILETFAGIKGESAVERLISAEVQFSIANEMVLNPMDFFIRRTGRLYFDIDSIREHQNAVLSEFQEAFGYAAEQLSEFKTALEEALESHSNFSLERV
ncbi:MAG: glycerol-3-phosphate dehydrogenase/oxidase, partial [Bacteroidota bacterium]